jgi:outer membrane protein OmpA-like peptidoglycan-associated protein
VNSRIIAVLFALTVGIAAAQMSDFKGYKDPALFTRMPHYYLSGEDDFVEKAFNAFEFTVKGGATQSVEGRHLRYAYTFDEAAGTSPSFLQVVRNYEAAAKSIGGEILWDDTRRTTIRIAKNGLETWLALEVYNEGRVYDLNIIERQLMKQEVFANAAALNSGLKATGHVEVPGIFFDFGKSDVKPESDAALKEVAAMIGANPGLKVWVVGHTDNVGSADGNMKLSEARAAAVVKALSQRGIAPGQLAPHGAGPYAPVASNSTDDGRARNRRVELVAQP